VKVAIISPSIDAYSETFIRAHRNIDAETLFYFGGSVPRFLDGEGVLDGSFFKKALDVLSIRLRVSTFDSLAEKAFAKSLRKKGVDVVLAEYGPTAAAVMNVCSRLSIPLVAHFHGFDASKHVVLDKHQDLYRQLFQQAESIIVVSNAMAGKLESLGCPKKKLVLNPYGPNKDFFHLSPDRDSNQIVAVGRFVEKKAPHLTLLAFKKVLESFPDAHLVMAGDGPLLGPCKDLAGALGISEKTRFAGAVGHDEVKNLFTGSFLFVQHSVIADDGDSEGTPVAVLEASAASLPVVSTRHAGIPDVIVNGETGLLGEERDVDAMAASIIRLFRDRKLADDLGMKGRENILWNFSMEKHLGRLEEVLRSAIESK